MWLNLFHEFDLDQFQKRIVIAGIDGRKLSPTMIYSALGTNDRNLYDRSVTTLRISGILKEINSAGKATNLARQTGKAKQDIPRFEVITPDKIVKSFSKRVYVYGLPAGVDEKILESAMSIFGEVATINLPRDKANGVIQGFAFIEYSNEESALRAVAIKTINIQGALAGILPYRPKKGRRRK